MESWHTQVSCFDSAFLLTGSCSSHIRLEINAHLQEGVQGLLDLTEL